MGVRGDSLCNILGRRAGVFFLPVSSQPQPRPSASLHSIPVVDYNALQSWPLNPPMDRLFGLRLTLSESFDYRLSIRSSRDAQVTTAVSRGRIRARATRRVRFASSLSWATRLQLTTSSQTADECGLFAHWRH
jgi:hypothetical protein